ncbi:hypothetical protein KY290_022182 [Solanum tuberosum]|uniref:Uncharacterized protein n=1 Tax=Solanum tuberosum TaxID=4113 RepID=A0ABQ7V3M6_SOLTU|nr:hypothetical protein KY290_022182 [Solanum tuberosum]
MDFSLNFSSRPPTDSSPHQKILWTLDAWRSTDRASEQIFSFVLEMWYIWHLSLWMPTVAENLSWHKCILPDELFKPSKMAAIQKILLSCVRHASFTMHPSFMQAVQNKALHRKLLIFKSSSKVTMESGGIWLWPCCMV